jgi:hypothetical protein
MTIQRPRRIAKAGPALAEERAVKLLKPLQAARAELETAGNIDGASALTRAIAAVLEAAGLASAPLMTKVAFSELQRLVMTEPRQSTREHYERQLTIELAKRQARTIR